MFSLKNEKRSKKPIKTSLSIATILVAVTILSVAVHFHFERNNRVEEIDGDKVEVIKVEGNNNIITVNVHIEDSDPSVPQETETSSEESLVGFETETYVRLAGVADRTWRKSAEAKVGDKIEFRIEYRNTSDESQTGVAVRDVLPSNLRYIDGSTILKNSNHPKGATAKQNYLVTDDTKIGNYEPSANAYIYFQAEVIDEDLVTGTNFLKNWGQSGVGETTIQDFAEVVVIKE